MPKAPRDPVSTFWSLVGRGAKDACWPWLGSCRPSGYGRFYIGRQAVSTHRYAYELTHGSIEPTKVIMHSCDNPPCCNPAHLSQGTQADNVADRDRKGRHKVSWGERNGRAKVTAEQVRGIRRDYADGGSGRRGKRGAVTYPTLAAKYDTTPAVVGKVVRGERWTHISPTCVARPSRPT